MFSRPGKGPKFFDRFADGAASGKEIRYGQQEPSGLNQAPALTATCAKTVTEGGEKQFEKQLYAPVRGMASLFRSFSNLLLKRPLATQCVTSAILFASGDIIAQQAIERKREKHDFSRTARLTFFGGCLLGPPVSKWITFLNRLHFATPTKAVIYRTWLDQALMAPLVVGWFFTSMSLMEGKGLSGVVDGLSTMYAPTLMRGWAVYTPTQIINFALVPPQFRFVFVGVINLVWNAYLSTVNARLSLGRDIEEPVGY